MGIRDRGYSFNTSGNGVEEATSYLAAQLGRLKKTDIIRIKLMDDLGNSTHWLSLDNELAVGIKKLAAKIKK